MELWQIGGIAAAGLAIVAVITFIAKNSFVLDKNYYNNRWQRVLKSLKEGDAGKKLAVIDADKLVDHALKARKIGGETMGDRLIAAEDLLGKNYQNIWDAHKYRNRLVHEEVKLKNNDVKFALRAYERALKDLGAL